MTAVNRRYFRKFITLVSLPSLSSCITTLPCRSRFAITIKQVHRSMFEHSGMLTLYHALNKRTRRLRRTMVFAFITYPSCTLYLAIYAVHSGLLIPYFKLWEIIFHGLLSYIFFCLLINCKCNQSSAIYICRYQNSFVFLPYYGRNNLC